MTAPLLEARHLVKRFHGIKVVDDVSFVVRPGEVVGYLGPNGSGKTTTGRMMTGLMEPSAGMVLFEGRSIGDDPVGYRRRLGYVPEEPALYSFLSGREQLQLIGRLREVPEDVLEHRMRALLELFGLADAAEQSISAYSKGMKQKVLIIGALLHDPGRPDLRRAGFRPRRHRGARAAASGAPARQPRQSRALQLSRARGGREAVHAGHRPAPRPRSSPRTRSTSCAR